MAREETIKDFAGRFIAIYEYHDNGDIDMAKVMKCYIKNGVNVIRIGLHSSENLVSDSTYFAGPNHPALGELCENEIYLSLIEEELNKN